MNTLQYSIQFDGALAFLSLFGLLPSLWSFFKKERLNAIEKRIFSITLWVSLHFLFRFFFEFFDLRGVGGLMYTTSVFFVFSVARYFETLLRRHFPLWFKIFLIIGMLFFVVVANIGLLQGNIRMLLPYGAYVIFLQLVVFCFVIFRNRDDYTKIENQMLRNSALVLLAIGPMFLSDVTTFHASEGSPLPKFGVLGALIFSYFSLFDKTLTRGPYFPLLNVIKSALIALLIIVPLRVIIQNDEMWFWGRLFILVFGMHLAMRIFNATQHFDNKSESGQFLKYFNDADQSSVLRFILSFRDFYKNIEIEILRLDKLTGYDVSAIKTFMNKHKKAYFSRDLIELIRDSEVEMSDSEKDVLDQIESLLEKKNMTHVMRVGFRDVYFVFLCVPLVNYEQTIELHMRAIHDKAALIEASTSS